MTQETRARTVDTWSRWQGLIVTRDLATNAESVWQRDVANGLWTVTVGVGDSEYVDSSFHTVRLEGKTVMDRWPSTQAKWQNQVTAQVTVTDGKLTVDAIGGQTTKFSWITAALSTNAPVATSPALIGWHYKPPTDGSTAAALAARYGRFTLSGTDEPFRDAVVLAGGPQPLLYMQTLAIQDPGSTTAQPWRNQTANQPGDFAAISRDHPDWFQLDSAGNRLHMDRATDNFFMMDPGNSGWRAFALSRLKDYYVTNGWKGGVMLDNIELNLNKRDRVGNIPAKYTTTTAYTAAIEGMLAYFYNNWAKGASIPLTASMIEWNYDDADLATRARYSQYLSGMQHECFGTTWSSGSWLLPDRWLMDLRRVEEATARGDSVILFSQGDRTDTTRQQFAYASYLLAWAPGVSFRYHKTSTHYTEDWWYSDYDLKLGTPTGARYQSGSAWKRSFTHGTVTVDPVAHTSTITVT
jgi:hypothetical protein